MLPISAPCFRVYAKEPEVKCQDPHDLCLSLAPCLPFGIFKVDDFDGCQCPDLSLAHCHVPYRYLVTEVAVVDDAFHVRLVHGSEEHGVDVLTDAKREEDYYYICNKGKLRKAHFLLRGIVFKDRHMPFGCDGLRSNYCFCGRTYHMPDQDHEFDDNWGQCDGCDKWCHLQCFVEYKLIPPNFADLPDVEAFCPECHDRRTGSTHLTTTGCSAVDGTSPCDASPRTC